MGSRPMKRKEKMHRMIKLIVRDAQNSSAKSGKLLRGLPTTSRYLESVIITTALAKDVFVVSLSRLAVKLVGKCGLCKLSRVKAGNFFLTRQNMMGLNYRMYGFPFYNDCV